MYILIFIILVSNLNVIYTDICADITYDCDACLGNSFHCVWCTDEVHNDTRCRLERSPVVNSDWCQNIVDPTTEPANIIKNEDYRPKTKMAEAVQLKPQHVRIKSRPRETVEFLISYKPSLERPTDVYYLFDSSKLAKMYKKHFDTQVHKIYEALKEISGDIRFGIGTLDTERIHDVSVVNKTIFQSDLALTEDISRITDYEFQHDNGSSIVSLLKGLMEAIESEDNNGIHYGRKTIITLFCDPRTSVSDENTTQDVYNYIKMINKIVEDKHINIIFTGEEDYPDEYKILAGKLKGASYVELNDNDEDHVVDFVNLIKDEYLKTAHNLELSVGVIPPHLSVKVTPDCEKLGSRCIRKIQAGISLHMLVTVFMKQFPRDTKYKQAVMIKVIGSNELLTIDIEALCYCECGEKAEANSEKCNAMGDYTCGVCKCKDGRYGDSCQCIGNYVEDGWKKCRAGPDDFYLSGCNGHGDCICGECRCHEGYEGQHCGNVIKSD